MSRPSYLVPKSSSVSFLLNPLPPFACLPICLLSSSAYMARVTCQTILFRQPIKLQNHWNAEMIPTMAFMCQHSTVLTMHCSEHAISTTSLMRKCFQGLLSFCLCSVFLMLDSSKNTKNIPTLIVDLIPLGMSTLGDLKWPSLLHFHCSGKWEVSYYGFAVLNLDWKRWQGSHNIFIFITDSASLEVPGGSALASTDTN